MLLVFSFWLIGMAILFSGGFFNTLGLSLIFSSLMLCSYAIWDWRKTTNGKNRGIKIFIDKGDDTSTALPDKEVTGRTQGSSLTLRSCRGEPCVRPDFATRSCGAPVKSRFAITDSWEIPIITLLLLIICQLTLVCSWLIQIPLDSPLMSVAIVISIVSTAIGIFWSIYSPLGWWLQLTSFLLLNLILLFSIQNLQIDILVFQNDSAAALLEGRNPYTLTFPNISDKGDASHEYGAGMSVNGRLQFGYVYLPLTLLGVMPGYLLGDSRFSYVVATLLSSLFLFGWRARGVKALLGALFLWSPATLLIFRGYTEYLVASFLCFILYCSLRQIRWLPFACGLFLASKQYAVLCLPLLWLLGPLWTARPVTGKLRPSNSILTKRERIGSYMMLCGQSLIVAALISLPMAVWDWDAFFYSSLKLQFLQPFRADSLSFSALSSYWGWGALPQWLPFMMLMASITISLKTLCASASNFFLSLSWMFFLFFSFSKQGMANYYYFVIVAIVCAIVARIEEEQLVTKSFA